MVDIFGRKVKVGDILFRRGGTYGMEPFLVTEIRDKRVKAKLVQLRWQRFDDYTPRFHELSTCEVYIAKTNYCIPYDRGADHSRIMHYWKLAIEDDWMALTPDQRVELSDWLFVNELRG